MVGVKEVVLNAGVMRDRFVVCRNPDEAVRDGAIRDRLLGGLEAAIAGSDERSPAERAKLACDLRGKPTNRRVLRTTKAGLLRIDRAAVRADAKLDGKFLLRTSNPTLSAADVATGYKQLLEVERAWRDMKTTLDLRPVYHRKEQRIRAHVLLCWLSLLLVRLAEQAAARSGATCASSSTSSTSGASQAPPGRSPSGPSSRPVRRPSLRALDVPEPPRYVRVATPEAATAAVAG